MRINEEPTGANHPRLETSLKGILPATNRRSESPTALTNQRVEEGCSPERITHARVPCACVGASRSSWTPAASMWLIEEENGGGVTRDRTRNRDDGKVGKKMNSGGVTIGKHWRGCVLHEVHNVHSVVNMVVVVVDGKFILVVLEHDVFGHDFELILHLEDIVPMYQLDEISANCIVAYIWHLYKNMMTDTIRGKFRFMNPHSIPFIMTTPRDNKGKLEQLNQRATVLSDRLSSASVDQLVLVPCNVGFHWILIVIQPYTELVYVLDSLSHRMRYDDWKYIVEMALRLFNSNKGRKGRKKPVWELLQAPRQPDGKQCGYYVMRFMRQIIAEIETIERDGLRSIFKAAEYTRAEIDEVRSEVADCIQDHIYE
ncbi:uncharacterized protein LOC141837227 [Curcuma longa]|uniref:uncharacterized protein LOC141837227 n=1 Tax=Curcuma longa TaxID=136217 RepID=UPI003D9F7CDF